MYTYVFFFFKQKTAYEMRISDWSSDVCSSDLLRDRGGRVELRGEAAVAPGALRPRDGAKVGELVGAVDGRAGVGRGHAGRRGGRRRGRSGRRGRRGNDDHAFARRGNAIGAARSEEHTSELQSLMRISYAVFCLKKKTI